MARKPTCRPKIHNLLAWPLHRLWSADETTAYKDEFAGLARLELLPIPEGEEVSWPDEPAKQRDVWQRSLTTMRKKLIDYCDAIVLLGGKVEGFAGHIPGVAEEAQLALAAEKPVYLCGGFGGCVADMLAMVRPDDAITSFDRSAARAHPETGQGYTDVLSKLEKHKGAEPDNGLNAADNAQLASTVNSDHLAMLILHGLVRIPKD